MPRVRERYPAPVPPRGVRGDEQVQAGVRHERALFGVIDDRQRAADALAVVVRLGELHQVVEGLVAEVPVLARRDGLHSRAVSAHPDRAGPEAAEQHGCGGKTGSVSPERVPAGCALMRASRALCVSWRAPAAPTAAATATAGDGVRAHACRWPAAGASNGRDPCHAPSMATRIMAPASGSRVLTSRETAARGHLACARPLRLLPMRSSRCDVFLFPSDVIGVATWCGQGPSFGTFATSIVNFP